MKNLIKILMAPIVLVGVSLAVAGGGIYIYESQRSDQREQQIDNFDNVDSIDTLNQIKENDVQIKIKAEKSPQASVLLLSPNGKETWDLKSTQKIKWGTESGENSKVDIYLDEQYYPPAACLGPDPCGPYFHIYPIAKNIAGETHNWIVTTPVINGKMYTGKFTVRICPAGATTGCDSSDAEFSIVNLTSDNDQAPTISNISGPTTINLGQTGTWTVNANDPENSDLTYHSPEILFGGAALTDGHGYSLISKKGNIFSFSFPESGVYSLTFQVSDEYEKRASKQLILRVQ